MMNKFFFLMIVFLGTMTTRMQSQKPYTIYPIPQSQVAGQGNVAFTQTVTVVCEAGIDAPTKKRAEQVLASAGLQAVFSEIPSVSASNLYLGVAGSGGTTDQKAAALNLSREVLKKSGKYDRHILHLAEEGRNAQVVILGESTEATFHALASLEQILENGTEQLPAVTLNDYADQQSRGLVEGYYGYPYSLEMKKDLMRFMMRMKMNTYMYGAKSDSYHSEKWEQPYPETLTPEQIKNGLLSQNMMRELTQVSAETKVNFIWAVHPGNDFVGNPNVVGRIMRKFDSMYKLGVRRFAIFVDDVGVPTTEEDCKTNADRLTAVQKAIDDKWNTADADPADQVKPLHFVPQVYTLSWVDEGKRKIFYKALSQTPEKITIYFTGRNVWTVPNSNDLQVIKKELGRSAAWWWNYPCNDNSDGQIYPSDTYYNFFEMPAVDDNARLPISLNNGLGIVSNPMQQAQVSKTALFSVADYAWNNRGFNNKKSWEASFKAILDTPEKREAYKAIIPYLRWNDPSEMQSAINAYKADRPQSLLNILTRLEKAIEVMVGLKNSAIATDRMLYADLAPWLLKLQSMTRIGKEMLKAYSAPTNEEKWDSYLSQIDSIQGLETNKAFTAYALEGLGEGISVSYRQSQPAHKFFYPFMNHLKESGPGHKFFDTPVNDIETLRSTTGIFGKAYLTNGQAYINVSSAQIPPGGYIGFTLKEAVLPSGMTATSEFLRQHHVLYSLNGKQWKRLTDTTFPQGEFVKHLVCQNPSEKPINIRLNQNVLALRMPSLPEMSDISVPSDRFGDGTGTTLGKRAIIDNNPATFFACHQNQADNDLYTVTLQQPTDVTEVRLYFGTKNEDYLQSGSIEVSADGNEWTVFKLKGSNATHGGNAQATVFASEVKYLDFTGNMKNARFVRLKIVSAKTNKWLRLYDIQINPSVYASMFKASTTDKAGVRHDEASDRKPYTCITKARGGELHHTFFNATYLDAVEIYWQPNKWKGEKPEIEISEDGTTWKNVGRLQSSLTHVKLSADKAATFMRLVWKGTSVPAIHEIKEVHSTTEHPTIGITGIERISNAALASPPQHIYDIHGHLLRTDGNTDGLPTGLYVVGGKKLILK